MQAQRHSVPMHDKLPMREQVIVGATWIPCSDNMADGSFLAQVHSVAETTSANLAAFSDQHAIDQTTRARSVVGPGT